MLGVHYVPVKSDLTDLYDIMAFFRGLKEDGSDGHDEMAKEIATEGRVWSQSYWRKEDLVAYQFRYVSDFTTQEQEIDTDNLFGIQTLLRAGQADVTESIEDGLRNE